MAESCQMDDLITPKKGWLGSCDPFLPAQMARH